MRFLAAILLAASAFAIGTARAQEPQAPARVTPPPAAAVFDYQIGGAYRPGHGVRIVDRDRTDSPAAGDYNICYVNAFQTQPGAGRWWKREHRTLLLPDGHGGFLTDPDWPGEYLLDTSTAARRAAIARIVGGWIDGCARKGFDAVEPDNLDSWTRKGVDRRLTRADNLDLAARLARRAHGDGLAIAQKNTVEVSQAGRDQVHFDFAIAEECQVYHECGGYRGYYGRRVYEIEYQRTAYRAACASRGGTMSIILRDREVTPRGNPHYLYQHC